MSHSWLVKTKTGKVQGPFEESVIISKIKSKIFTGDEMISQYPYGQWQNISSYPLFYEHLLKVITSNKKRRRLIDESNSTGNLDDLDTLSIEDDNDYTDSESEDMYQSHPSVFEKKKQKSIFSSLQDIKPFKKVRIQSQFEDDATIIGSVKRSKWYSSKKIQKNLVLILIVFLGISIVFALFLDTHSNKSTTTADGRYSVELRAPQLQKQSSLNQKEVSIAIKKGLSFYLEDQHSSYLKAQNAFIRAIEGDPKNSTAMFYLCLNYLELWPFTKKDLKAQKTIHSIVKLVDRVDPQSGYSIACKVVQMIINEKSGKADTLVQTAIDSSKQVETELTLPFFYYLRSLIKKDKFQLESALTNIEFAKNTNTQWIKLFVEKGIIYKTQNRLSESLKSFSQALKINPQHKKSLLMKGILEYQFLNKLDRAQRTLQTALVSNEKVASFYLKETYYTLTLIALKTNKRSQVLKFAKQAYLLDPLNNELKEILSQFGKVEVVDKEQMQLSQLIEQGDQLSREGRKHEAQSYYKTAFETQENPIAATKLGRLLWKSGLPYEAIGWLKKAISVDPKYITAYTLMASYYSELHDFENAFSILKKASQISPKSIDILKGYASMELKRKDIGATISYAKQALSLYESDVDSLILLSKALVQSEFYTEALNTASQAKELDSNNKEAQIQFARTIAFVNSVDTAHDYFENLINASHPNSDNYFKYVIATSQFLFDHQKYNEALTSLRRLNHVEEKNVGYHLLYGRILKAHGRSYSNNAYKEFITAAALNPASLEPQFELAQLFKETGQFKKSEEYFYKILKSNPRYPNIRLYIAQINYTRALQFIKKEGKITNNSKKYFLKALEEIKRDTQLNPRSVESYELAARIHYRMKKYTLCAHAVQKSIELTPDRIELYIQAARCYRHSGRVDLAQQILNKVADLSGNNLSSNALVYKDLGAIYEINKDFENAAKAYAIYINLLPNARDRQIIERRIKNFGQ